MNMTPKCAAIFIFKSHIFLCLLSLPMVSGFCPKGCQCDDKRLKVICANTTLDVLPIALNTRIKHIRMSHNKIRIVDASFQVFYNSKMPFIIINPMWCLLNFSSMLPIKSQTIAPVSLFCICQLKMINKKLFLGTPSNSPIRYCSLVINGPS